MNESNLSSGRRLALALAARERDFANIWRRIKSDSERAAVFRALDPLGLEGEPVISVQFNSASNRQWLELQLSKTAPHGIGWATYHCADVAEHAERLVTPSSTPALWLAATYYADFAAHLLGSRQRENS